jgi:hypothetical protein
MSSYVVGLVISCMPDRSRKRPGDSNQLAKLITDIATSDIDDAPRTKAGTRCRGARPQRWFEGREGSCGQDDVRGT